MYTLIYKYPCVYRYTYVRLANFGIPVYFLCYIKKEQAFEIVSKIIFDSANQLIVGGNPAFESERVLFHIEMVMGEWGYRSALVSQYCDSIKQENDIMREMGIEE